MMNLFNIFSRISWEKSSKIFKSIHVGSKKISRNAILSKQRSYQKLVCPNRCQGRNYISTLRDKEVRVSGSDNDRNRIYALSSKKFNPVRGQARSWLDAGASLRKVAGSEGSVFR
jgi:hypothetical protein